MAAAGVVRVRVLVDLAASGAVVCVEGWLREGCGDVVVRVRLASGSGGGGGANHFILYFISFPFLPFSFQKKIKCGPAEIGRGGEP